MDQPEIRWCQGDNLWLLQIPRPWHVENLWFKTREEAEKALSTDHENGEEE